MSENIYVDSNNTNLQQALDAALEQARKSVGPQFTWHFEGIKGVASKDGSVSMRFLITVTV